MSRHNSTQQDPTGVEQQREEVVASVNSLLARADVSARAKDAARHRKQSIDPNWKPMAAAGAAAVAVAAVIVFRRRRKGDLR